MLSLAQVAEATGGRVIGAGERPLTSVSTDTRTLAPGALFVALRGPSFDGHDFVAAALERRAAAVLVGRADAVPAGASGVVVGDPLAALGRLAAWHRRRMPAQVMALTGSLGKTTTKELAAAILGELGPTLATEGNLNNHIGVPLTLLRLRPEHQLAVIEMGCNDFGEIAALAELAGPSIGLVTTVAGVHLEKLIDLDGVARAKGELLAALPPEGTAVVNLDDPRVRAMGSPARERLGWGAAPEADVRLRGREVVTRGDGAAQVVELEIAGRGTIRPRLRLLGEHNARNAAAAAALALAAGAGSEAIEAGLGRVGAQRGRLRLCAGRGGLRVIDDSYNASPDAVAAALAVAGESRGDDRAWLLLGEMAELGPEAEAIHRRVGGLAAGAGLAGLIAVGAAGAEALRQGALAGGMSAEAAWIAETPERAAELVLARAAAGDVVLVKGSRVARMERAVSALCGE